MRLIHIIILFVLICNNLYAETISSLVDIAKGQKLYSIILYTDRTLLDSKELLNIYKIIDMGDKVVPELHQLLLDSKDNESKYCIIFCLGGIKNKSSLPDFFEGIESSDRSLNTISEIALLNYRDTISDEYISYSQSEKWKVRTSLAYIFGELKNDKWIDILVKYLDDQNEVVRRSAANALGNYKTKKAVSALIEHLNSKDEFLANNCNVSLTKIKGDIINTNEELRNWFKDKYHE